MTFCNKLNSLSPETFGFFLRMFLYISSIEMVCSRVPPRSVPQIYYSKTTQMMKETGLREYSQGEQ